ncbi:MULTISPECIES: lipoprotein-releasing ABC transporter permease subunit [Pseudomonadaceae]|jgi:lipoprotein-releasing system permease protein|uniref:Multidrug ABC transporter substrate-binding protein n=2 Tax=Pseudomonadaceae TaxID=135621 RepID=A0ABX3IM33_9PSED|nr:MULTISPECIES: lipoprotein-releasing ABC transporter permease subunit [Pseudomonas]KTT56557.1 multidrug ABC transporter substrate-binding protein [Pseudomonas psychrotolerans]MBA1213256.1 lipoprotein-releasing ABC transporter permease subunit [Pseudomonas psychrotolerans]MBH3332293.1 lipoprotein-releasing ABC transporter permease subunit [Pseudomonas oryzihabitans]NMZ47556.1 lipoprotein-releasing ABC transporter permease subunit [Pseudomonas oryzihabitans]NMZ62775.1 lipoprotein-releasing ABC
MFRPLSLFIGLRYTRAKRRKSFISFFSLVSMFGLALGVLAMILVLSVMNGFQEEMRGRILGMVPHAFISAAQPLDDWRPLAAKAEQQPHVLAAVPYTQLQGMLSVRGRMQPLLVDGIDPAQEKRVSIVGERMTQGSLDALKPGEFGIVLGEIAARRFQLELGSQVTVIIPEVGATGSITPRLRRFTVVGTFKVGAELDASLALINVADAAPLKGWQPGQVESIRLALDDLFQAPRISRDVAKALGDGYQARDWTISQGSLFQAMQMEKTMIGLLLLLIVAVAAFNIIATLIMVVADKKADIAILRTLGATPGQIMAVFMVQGTVIGLVGTLIGGVLGVIAALNVSSWIAALERLVGHKLFGGDMYFISNLPSRLELEDVVLIAVAALSMSFLATLYPAWRASRTSPAEALRYD